MASPSETVTEPLETTESQQPHGLSFHQQCKIFDETFHGKHSHRDNAAYILYIVLGLLPPNTPPYILAPGHPFHDHWNDLCCMNVYTHQDTTSGPAKEVVKRCEGQLKKSSLMEGISKLVKTSKGTAGESLEEKVLVDAKHFLCKICRKDKSSVEQSAARIKEAVVKWRDLFPGRLSREPSAAEVKSVISQLEGEGLCRQETEQEKQARAVERMRSLALRGRHPRYRAPRRGRHA